MKTEKLRITSLFIATIALIIAILSFGTLVSAQDSEKIIEAQTTETETNQGSETGTEAQPTEIRIETYKYVTQSGDSYTKMARKAVQTYGIQTSTNLSGAQIVYVETNLTIIAGSPELSKGQEVAIEQSVVSEWVEKAGQLSAKQTTAWQVYADTIDFNTNAVGEVQAQ